MPRGSPGVGPLTAIPTEFDGITYRSRTEARWAVFFKTAGLEALYEAEGFDLDGTYYLPDFFIPAWQIFIEVKPLATLLPQERRKAAALAATSGHSVLVVLGDPGRRSGVLFQSDGEVLRAAFFAKCRRCPATVISYEFGENGVDGWGMFPLGSECGLPPYCTEKFPSFGAGFDEAIKSATTLRWSAPK